jgi:hypothetical protein
MSPGRGIKTRSQDPVRRPWPVHLEGVGHHSVAGSRRDQRRPVVGMGRRLLRQQEPSADPDPLGPGHQRCRDTPRGPDPTGGQHRHGDGVEHLVEKRQNADRAAHVAARLDALSDDEVAAGRLRRDGFLDRADLPGHQGTTVAAELNERRVRITEEELDHLHEWRDRGDRLAIKERDQETRADMLLRRRTSPAALERLEQGRPIEPARAHHPQATRRGNGVGQLRGADAATHGGELDGDLTADQLGEPSSHPANIDTCPATRPATAIEWRHLAREGVRFLGKAPSAASGKHNGARRRVRRHGVARSCWDW